MRLQKKGLGNSLCVQTPLELKEVVVGKKKEEVTPTKQQVAGSDTLTKDIARREKERKDRGERKGEFRVAGKD